MRNAYDCARYYIKKGADSTPNTYDGNMKLQKLLVLADMAYLAEFQEPLFGDEVLAFENGPVVENIRLRYRNDYQGFEEDSARFAPDFNEREYGTLNDVLGVYGHLSARQLSELSHMFKSWRQAYAHGTADSGYHDKKMSIVNFKTYPEDIEAVGRAIKAYRNTKKNATRFELINGVRFYYDDMQMTEEIISELEKFSKSRSCEDDAYSVYMRDGKLVIY